MRLFIAIPLPPDIRRAVAQAARALRERGAAGRFVLEENYHVTLHFLGEQGALAEVVEAMQEAMRDARPMLLRLTDYGAFQAGAGRTGYLGVLDEGGELARVYEMLEQALWDRGFARNRQRLTPHITIGRNITGDEGFSCAQRAAFTAREIVLYESRRVGERMDYVQVHRERTGP